MVQSVLARKLSLFAYSHKYTIVCCEVVIIGILSDLLALSRREVTYKILLTRSLIKQSCHECNNQTPTTGTFVNKSLYY